MAHVSRFLDPSLVERLNQLQVSARSVVEGNTAGQHRSPVKGASIEFRQHRFYAPAKSIRQGLARLRHDRHEVIAMRILDANEIQFPFRRWARFRGTEGEASILTETGLARQTYQRNFRKHQRELEEAFHLLRG